MKLFTASFLLAGLAAVSFGQAPPMNGAIINPRVFNDFPSSTFTSVNTYPTTINLNDQNVVGATGFANRHTWNFSNTAGASAYEFRPDSFFSVTWSMSLTGTGTTRKEAGFLIDDRGTGFGQGQFIVNTDAHEIVAFGGPLPFFSFNPLGQSYNSGSTITMGLDYYRGTDGRRKVQYRANGIASGELDITNAENSLFRAAGTGAGGSLGGYMQVVGAATGPNGGVANWSNITFAPVPEPMTLLGLGVGIAILGKRRKASKR